MTERARLRCFLDNLSTSVLRLCDSRNLSQEAASEQCELSSRDFADIARGKTAPTILTLEKLCAGFDLTPHDLLIPASIQQAVSFRTSMDVSQIQCFLCVFAHTYFPICPRCRVTPDRQHQSFCERCGQCLSCKNFSNPTIILPEE